MIISIKILIIISIKIYGDNNTQILHVNEIPIVLEAEDNVIRISKDDIFL